jgi:hypothetical protein
MSSPLPLPPEPVDTPPFQKKPYISRLVVKASRNDLGYEIEFTFPAPPTKEEFEAARKSGLESIRAWLTWPNEKALAPVSEEDFNRLHWEESAGPKLGDFDVAYRDHDQPRDTWQRCFDFLKAENADINKHFSPEGFAYFYWLYPEKYQDKIFRKKRNGAPQP